MAKHRRHDIVIGPAHDGGYYLLGMRRPLPKLFVDIPWSTAQVFTETCARTQTMGLRVAVLPKHRDIDTHADLACHDELSLSLVS